MLTCQITRVAPARSNLRSCRALCDHPGHPARGTLSRDSSYTDLAEALNCRIECAGSVPGPASLPHLARNRPGVRHGTHMPELVRVSHQADCLDPPAEHVERQRADHLAVPIAKDRARLGIHLVWLHSRVDAGEHRREPGEPAGHVIGAE